MSMQQNSSQPLADVELTEDEVVDFLSNNPEFFEQHLSLLEQLTIPHPCGDAVSLIERQLSMFREQNGQLRSKMMDLVRVARDNSSTHERVHRLTLALLEATTIDEVLNCVQVKLRDEFAADLVRFHLFMEPNENSSDLGVRYISRDDQEMSLFSEFFAMHRPLCGRLRPDQVRYLFGDSAEQVGSAVLIPLSGGDRLGMLAIGSYSEERFHPGMGTLVLGQLGELISYAILRHS